MRARGPPRGALLGPPPAWGRVGVACQEEGDFPPVTPLPAWGRAGLACGEVGGSPVTPSLESALGRDTLLWGRPGVPAPVGDLPTWGLVPGAGPWLSGQTSGPGQFRPQLALASADRCLGPRSPALSGPCDAPPPQGPRRGLLAGSPGGQGMPGGHPGTTRMAAPPVGVGGRWGPAGAAEPLCELRSHSSKRPLSRFTRSSSSRNHVL